MFKNSGELLNAIVESSTNFSQKFVSRLIGVSLLQKQWGAQIDLVALHKKVCHDIKNFAETIIKMAVCSKSSHKQVFAVQVLHSIHVKGKHPFQLGVQLSPKIMIGVILMLLNDPDRNVREHAANFAEAVHAVSMKKDCEVVDVFSETEKPSSV